MIVLDTNVILALASPALNPAVHAWARTMRPSEIAVTAMGEAELRSGLATLPAGQDRDAFEAAIHMLFTQFLAGRVLAFDHAAAGHYADIVTTRRDQGRPVATEDAITASIARARGATAIATKNTANFESCGVALLDPWQEGSQRPSDTVTKRKIVTAT